jgi:arabinan endo-1,5-alpha-L-arabinosidase
LKRLLPYTFIIVSLAGCAIIMREVTVQEALPTPANIAGITPAQAAEYILDQGVGTTAHDPVIIKDQEGQRYYLFATGRGIPIHVSDDLREWRYIDPALPTNPEWIRTTVPEATDLWAPDVVFYQGQYYLFYSASSFGKNLSAIGLASNVTLDPQNPEYEWVDQGLVIISTPDDNFNAIDPNFALDAEGQPWLLFGSFWSGIKMRKLDAKTLKLAEDDPTPRSLASRTRSPGAIEGAYLLRVASEYYLFVSHDFCCRGIDSTYKIKVGRSQAIAGPYLDREGNDLMSDGGTLILESSTRWKGPGHNSILVDDGHYYLVYHAYDAEAGGAPRLHIEELLWDEEGWPVAPRSIANP